MKKINTLILLLAMCLPSQSQNRSTGKPVVASPERRMALVIGMRDYLNTAPLVNTLNDTDDMERSLKKLGFNVVNKKNERLGAMQAIVDDFVNSLRPNDVVFFYFSGHGLGYLNDNYLMPIDARVECLEEIPRLTFSVNTLLSSFRSREVRNSFLVLDACRSLDKQITRCKSTSKNYTIPKGLIAPANQTAGDVIVFATESGETAEDNIDGRNGLFTQELLKYLTQPDLRLSEILIKTAQNVRSESIKMAKIDPEKKVQTPTVYGLLGQDFVFLKTDPNEEAKRKERIAQEKAEQESKDKEKAEQESKDKEIADLKRQLAEATKPAPPAPAAYRPRGGATIKFMDLPFADMVYVEGGTFMMGSNKGDAGAQDDEMVNGKKHSVTVGSFYMGKYEVTQAQWRGVMGADPPELYNKNCGNCPTDNVSWYDVQEFLTKLNKNEGRTASNGYRLPTEAEWEYAARGGSHWQNGYIYAGSNKIDEVAWYNGNYKESKHGEQGSTHPVGGKMANPLGIYDMTGNVREWCTDRYEGYTGSGIISSKYTFRVLRSSSWDLRPKYSRVACRSNAMGTSYQVGFRLVSPQ